MREPYGEGVASHTDPESCVVSCRDARRVNWIQDFILECYRF